MRISLLLPKLVPFQDGVFIGGVVNPVARLSKALTEKGHSIMIVAGSPEPEKEAEIRKAIDWAEIHFVRGTSSNPIKRGIQVFPGMLSRVIQVCKRSGCDLIHGHSGYFHWAGLVSLAGFFAQKPVLHTLYCPLADTINDRSHPFIKSPFAHLSLMRIDRIVAISGNVKQTFIDAGIKPSRIRVIPPSLDTERFGIHADGIDVRKKLGLGIEEKVILFVGNLTQTKGLDLLLVAFKNLSSVYPRLRLVYTVEKGSAITNEREGVIGDLIRRLDISDKIVELGFVDDMPSLMAACDVFVLPYRNTDGPSDYSIAMLEAMLVGRPVVATRVGANPEIIRDGETGILVEEDNVEALVRGIVEVLDNPVNAKAMGETGRHVVKERFDAAEIACKFEKLYCEVLKGKGIDGKGC